MASTDFERIIRTLKSHANPKNVEGMARYGINPKNTLGVSIPVLRKTAKEVGRNHALALKLWGSRIHEAHILAAFVDDPEEVTEAQMEHWVLDFDSWDVCDQVCMNLFWQTGVAYNKAVEWSKSDEEFVKRAGFALMAVLAWKDKTAGDEKFEKFLPHIKRAATDERNFVKKAVNWALRQIGKRNPRLRRKAIKCAKQMVGTDFKSARWVGKDALKELEKE